VPSRSGPARLARLLGARIRALRVEAKITQETAAWDCDMSKSHLSQLEAGLGFPSLPVLFALAKRFGVEPGDFLATDPTSPRTQLLDGIRTNDKEQVRRALKNLGIAPKAPLPKG
jgi:transcriptional regulator with XRE-family HTH domain